MSAHDITAAPDPDRVPSSHVRVWGQSLAGGVVALIAVTVLQRSVGLGRSIVVCRWLSSEALGQWDLSFGFLMAVGPLVVLGLPGAFGRFAEGYRNSHRLDRFLGVTAALSATSFAVFALLLFVFREHVSRLLLDSSQDAVITVDTDGRITGVNAGTVSMFGRSPSALEGSVLEDLLPYWTEILTGPGQSGEATGLVISM